MERSCYGQSPALVALSQIVISNLAGSNLINFPGNVERYPYHADFQLNTLKDQNLSMPEVDFIPFLCYL